MSQSLTGEPPEHAEATYSLELDLASSYLWRGMPVGSSPALFSSGEVSYRGAQVSLGFGAHVGSGVRPGGELVGFDMSFGYGVEWSRWVTAVSADVYAYSGSGQTSELSAEVGYQLLETERDNQDLSLFVRPAVDIVSNPGAWYSELSAVWAKALRYQLELETSGLMTVCSGSFTDYYLDERGAAVHLGSAGLGSSLSLPLGAFSLSAHGDLVHWLEPSLRLANAEGWLQYNTGIAVAFSP